MSAHGAARERKGLFPQVVLTDIKVGAAASAYLNVGTATVRRHSARE
jgi:hypothetical protein